MSVGRCLINTGNPDEEVIKEFISLHPDFDIFKKTYIPAIGITIPMIVRYIVHCYDKNSAIAIEHKAKWMIKKKEAALRSKFPTRSDNGAIKFTKEAEDIIFCKDIEVSKLIVRYQSMQFDNDFQMYSIYKELYHNVMLELQLFKFDKPSDLAKAIQNGEGILKDIEKLEYKIFSGDEERTLKSMLYEEAYKSSLELRPEHLATKREEGENIVDINPYGEGYKPSKLKFLNDQ